MATYNHKVAMSENLWLLVARRWLLVARRWPCLGTYGYLWLGGGHV